MFPYLFYMVLSETHCCSLHVLLYTQDIALWTACKNGELEQVRTAISSGADVRWRNPACHVSKQVYKNYYHNYYNKHCVTRNNHCCLRTIQQFTLPQSTAMMRLWRNYFERVLTQMLLIRYSHYGIDALLLYAAEIMFTSPCLEWVYSSHNYC